ncbi:glycoside hydrolase family 18 protein [Paraburkholderia sediminicola]|uniref:glycoside hydrolase family 18 protein n=1 Tax=Paraburkholderia sediminicola TaxID=458836 RepID=UPI0038BB33EE
MTQRNNRTSASGSAQQGRKDSKLVYNGDPGDKSGAKGATEKKYQMNSYKPATEVEKFSYTSGRVAKRVYNSYKPNDTKVFGYYTDWSQYDGRYDGEFGDDQCGRGIDLMLLDAKAYDKLVLGFAGIVGDKGEKQQTVDQAALDFGRKKDEATFVDAWGDVASYRNCGFAGWVSNDYKALFHQDTAQGVLGGLRKLKAKNPDLVLSFSIGGWTMSEAFHWVVADPARRETLINSILDLFERFPMFAAIDLDWEYPAAEGNDGNTYSDSDTPNFQALVRELRQALDGAGRNDVMISIAASAALSKMQKADLKGMLDAGVHGINLMTYDFFGTPWAPKLAHHTNLHPSHPGDPDEFNVDVAIDYLVQIGVPLNRVAIGYAAYSRSARNAKITSLSPLEGTYDPGTGTTTGSFESGATEWYDLIYNYLDLENQRGINGYDVYTDEVADADYLYSADSKLFVSVDTPRTVKAKGEYVCQRGLAGLFTWTIDMDAGVLVNAAREGLGNEIAKQTIDMSPFYFKGINVQGGNRPPVAAIDGPLEAFAGDTVHFSGQRSNDPDGDALTYRWSASGLPFDGATTVEVDGVVPTDGATSYVVKLTVDDGHGNANTAQVTLNVKSRTGQPPVARMTMQLASGLAFQLSGTASFDPDGDPLSYAWEAPQLPFNGSREPVVNGVVPGVDKTTDYWIQLSVSDGTSTSSEAIYLEATPSPGGSVQAVITGKTKVESGAPLSLSGADSTGPAPLVYKWSAPGLSFDGSDQVSVTVTTPALTQTTEYPVQLSVTGHGGDGAQSVASVIVTVVASQDTGTWKPQDYPGGSEVTHDYRGQGLRKYCSLWWASRSDEPGDPACTSTHENDGKVWQDLGSA